eukprot:270-Chlamydomonas_euryale.AAC.4
MTVRARAHVAGQPPQAGRKPDPCCDTRHTAGPLVGSEGIGGRLGRVCGWRTRVEGGSLESCFACCCCSVDGQGVRASGLSTPCCSAPAPCCCVPHPVAARTMAVK